MLRDLPKLDPIEEDGEIIPPIASLIPLADFQAMAKASVLTCEDGTGYYANEMQYDDEALVWLVPVGPAHTHVLWFDK